MGFTEKQLQAINESGQNIIVSAGAGSGKTAVLSERAMRILNEGTHINELLLLTFTKASATEMKERIRNKIKKSLETNPSLKKELELIDQSYITTFDAYALSVVKKYHYLLNIPSNIAITDASIINLKKTELMEETFNYFYEHPNDDYSKLIYDFCIKDDYLLKNYLKNIATKIDSLPNSEDYLNNYFENYGNDSFNKLCTEEYLEIIKDYISDIQKQATKLSYLIDGDLNDKITTILLPLYNSQTIDDIYIHINNIKLPSSPKGTEDEIKSEKDKLSKRINILKKLVNKYGNYETIVNSLNNTKPYIKAIIDIIKTFLSKLHIYKQENGIYDYQDIAMLSIKLVKEFDSVRNEISSSFKEIMIDEYQDTNDIQETFISYIEHNNVYMVGDIKQSIYRFRNANPYIFKTKYDNYSNHLNGTKIDLLKNFRSRKEVLDGVNKIFNLIMDNQMGGAEYHESHQMIPGNTDYDTIAKTDYNYQTRILEYNVPEDNSFTREEIEIFTIAKDIKEKIDTKYKVYDKDNKELREIRYSDFVILMDRGSEFDRYKKAFEYLGIPTTIYQDEKLNTSYDIYTLKNIIDFIIRINNQDYNTEFKYDYISIARSYLYELKDEEIFECFKDNSFKESLIYNTFEPLSKELTSVNIKTLLEKIISTTKMYEKVIKIGNVDSFMIRISKLLDIADNLSNLGYNIYTFKDYLEELLNSKEDMKYKPEIGDSNTVKVMTIHNSKGLEYPICYYSGLYRGFNTMELNDRFSYGGKYGIITPTFNKGIHNTIIKTLYSNNYYNEEVSEKIRLFYVALTRAREQMILLVPNEEEVQNELEENDTIDIFVRKKYRSFFDILKSIKDKIINYYETIDINSLSLTKDYLFNKQLNKIASNNKDKLLVNQITIKNDKIIEEEKHFSKSLHQIISKEIYNNLEFGLKVHETLEFIDFINPEYDLIEDNFIRKKIELFLTSDLLKDITTAKIYKEYEFIYNDNNTEYHGIIDLMLEYQDHIDIIDYKLNNIEDENYINQLNGYKKYIRTITTKPINIYLYSIISNTYKEL